MDGRIVGKCVGGGALVVDECVGDDVAKRGGIEHVERELYGGGECVQVVVVVEERKVDDGLSCGAD